MDNEYWRRKLRCLMVSYDEQSGGYYIHEYVTILQADEVGELVDGMTKFYNYYSRESIERENQSHIPGTPEWEASREKQLNEKARNTNPILNTKRERMKEKGYIYLIKSGQYHKIGITKNLKTRIKSFRTTLPLGLEVIHAFETDDMIPIEEALHRRFDDKRINGEWFDLCQDDVDYICGMQSQNGSGQ